MQTIQTVASTAATPAGSAASSAAGKRPLTRRQRKLNHKRQQRYAQLHAAAAAFSTDETRQMRAERSIRDFIAAGVRAYGSEWRREDEPPIERVQRMLNRVEQRLVRRGERGHKDPLDLRRMDRRFWEMLFICGWNPHWFDRAQDRSVDKWWTGDRLDGNYAWYWMDAMCRHQLMEMSRELFDAEAEFPDQERADAEDRRVRSRSTARPALRSNPAAAVVGGCHFPRFTGRETTGLEATDG